VFRCRTSNNSITLQIVGVSYLASEANVAAVIFGAAKVVLG
jgi:hypothetical protein